MTNKAGFWLTLIAGLSVFYVYALVLLAQGVREHWVLTLSMVLLAAHALELPLARRALKGRDLAYGRVALLTVLYGLLWWVPASRGVFGKA